MARPVDWKEFASSSGGGSFLTPAQARVIETYEAISPADVADELEGGKVRAASGSGRGLRAPHPPSPRNRAAATTSRR